jgi:hypothetical protein
MSRGSCYTSIEKLWFCDRDGSPEGGDAGRCIGGSVHDSPVAPCAGRPENCAKELDSRFAFSSYRATLPISGPWRKSNVDCRMRGAQTMMREYG